MVDSCANFEATRVSAVVAGLLDDLRRLRNEGHLSTEEYQRAVDALAERMGSSANAGGDSRPVK